MKRTLFTANVIGEGLIANDMPPESNPPPLLLGSEGLIVQYGDRETGLTCLVAAPDEDEAEAIILRTFGDEAHVDCIDTLAPLPYPVVRGLLTLAHAGTACDDDACEVHHPEAISAGPKQLEALAWFNAGRRSLREEMGGLLGG